MREYINIVQESSDSFYFESENEITEADLRQIYDGMVFMASKERQTVLGASAVAHLQYEDKVRYFNAVVIPLLPKA